MSKVKILSLTGVPVDSQLYKKGVHTPEDMGQEQIIKLLTFSQTPSKALMFERALKLAEIVDDLNYDKVMLEPSFFSPVIANVFTNLGISVVYPFYQNIHKEYVDTNGQPATQESYELISFVQA